MCDKMYKTISIIIFVQLNIIKFLIIDAEQQIPPDNLALNRIDAKVSSSCIKCLCEALTDCKPNIGCNGYTCGPFRITKSYWMDAGMPKLMQNSTKVHSVDQSDDLTEDYQRCTADFNCSAETIQGYMAKHLYDCNDDHQIDCYDYASLHYLGRDNCDNGIPRFFTTRLSDCLYREKRTGYRNR